jgi:non-SMC mitotic condensation complex subunit 1
VLEFVSHFQPSTKEEVYDIMNALDDRLSTPNSAVVLATVKVFLNLTLTMPYDHQQVNTVSDTESAGPERSAANIEKGTKSGGDGCNLHFVRRFWSASKTRW